MTHAGDRYGRLTLIEPVAYEKCHTARWKVRCDCGTVFEAALTNIKSGNTRSCGCLRKERLIERNRSRRKQ